MEIPKAIEILTLMGTPEFSGHTEDILAARKLGIEALKRHKEMSALVPAMPYPLLPGETPKDYHPNTVKILKQSQKTKEGE